MKIELLWVGPGWYQGLNFSSKRNWVQVSPNKNADPDPAWQWFDSEDNAKLILKLTAKPAWDRSKELY